MIFIGSVMKYSRKFEIAYLIRDVYFVNCIGMQFQNVNKNLAFPLLI